MSNAHVPPLRQGLRGDAIQGLDWIVISGPISEEFALRIASLCFLGPPVDHGDCPACCGILVGRSDVEGGCRWEHRDARRTRNATP